MCALFYENRLGIKKNVISSVDLFCPNTGTKIREPYHLNHVIPHRVERLSEDNVEEGPGFGCTSPEQSRIMISQKANSVTRKQVMITDTNLAFELVPLTPGVTDTSLSTS